MKKSIVLLSVFFCLLFSCKKESKNQYSHWYVGNDSFASNNVSYDQGGQSPQSDLQSFDKNNFFDLLFRIGALPTNGEYPFPADSEDYNPVKVDIYINYNDVGYHPSYASTSSLSASLVNGKAQYTLPPTWFVSYSNHDDSILVHGIFNQP